MRRLGPLFSAQFAENKLDAYAVFKSPNAVSKAFSSIPIRQRTTPVVATGRVTKEAGCPGTTQTGNSDQPASVGRVENPFVRAGIN